MIFALATIINAYSTFMAFHAFEFEKIWLNQVLYGFKQLLVAVQL